MAKRVNISYTDNEVEYYEKIEKELRTHLFMGVSQLHKYAISELYKKINTPVNLR
tara:strand:- start:443 stop:607 length:165 start_codon:yes stop_codon:yes gene_type:complete